MKYLSFKNRISSLGVILASLVLVVNGSAAVQALSQSDLNSIYGDSMWYWPDFSSVALSCSGSSSGTGNIAPGNGAPDGAAFPNLDPGAMASAIDTWVAQQNPNSALKGLGSTIVASAKNSNINPFLIAAIAKEETSMADPASYNVKYANNPFSREAASSQPNYPGAGPNAGTLWYKWSSVKASVDYTAPENQNAPGGGDIATYIRDEYGSQLDSNKLSAMFVKYAPPGENNTQQYIANVEAWIQALANLANGGTSSSSTNASVSAASGCSSDCANGSTGDAAILCEAKKYQGIYYFFGGGHESYSTFRQICPEAAIAAAAASSSVDSPGPCATDCSGLVSVAVDAAFNQSYVWTVAGSMQGDGAQYWESIDISDARAGDIVTTPEHVEIVDHVSGNSVYTFGSHYTGSQTGPITTSKSYWTGGAYHWVGPGGSQ